MQSTKIDTGRGRIGETEAADIEVSPPAERTVRLTLTKTQVDLLLVALDGRGLFAGAWFRLRAAKEALTL